MQFWPILQRPRRAIMAAWDGVFVLVGCVSDLFKMFQPLVRSHGAVWRNYEHVWLNQQQKILVFKTHEFAISNSYSSSFQKIKLALVEFSKNQTRTRRVRVTRSKLVPSLELGSEEEEEKRGLSAEAGRPLRTG